MYNTELHERLKDEASTVNIPVIINAIFTAAIVGNRSTSVELVQTFSKLQVQYI